MIKIGAYEIEVLTSIRKLKKPVWDSTLGGAHPAKRYEFLHCIETTYPNRQYRYFLIYRSDNGGHKLVALFFATQEYHDLQMMLPETVGCLIKLVRRAWPNFAHLSVAMTGCMETHGNHWWADGRYISKDKLFLLMDMLIRRYYRSLLYIVRDLGNSSINSTLLRDAAERAGYQTIASLPVAVLSLRSESADAHLARLKQNPRKIITKVIRAFEGSDYKVIKTGEFECYVEELYPLYLNVSRKAKEFQRQEFPKSFFVYLARHCKDMAEVTMLQAREGGIVAFTLSIYDRDTYNPFLFGRKLCDDRDPNFYNYLMWCDVNSAVEKSILDVDMGVTNYFPKQNIGARLQSYILLMSFCKGLLWLNRFLPRIIVNPQPKARNVYRNDNVNRINSIS